MKPIYQDEADIIAILEDVEEACWRFQSEGIDLADPDRHHATLQLQPPSIQSKRKTMSMSNPEVEAAISKVWEEIEKWYEENAPSLLQFLNESVSDENLRELETRVKISLPDDYKSSLKIHNGGIDIRSYNYLSVDEVLNTWSMRTEQSEQGTFEGRVVFEQGGGVIQNTWWDRRWIPFAKDSGGNLACIDMAPAAEGVEGQILYVEIASGPVASEYASFLKWLESYRDELAEGIYGFDAEAGEVLEKFKE